MNLRLLTDNSEPKLYMNIAANSVSIDNGLTLKCSSDEKELYITPPTIGNSGDILTRVGNSGNCAFLPAPGTAGVVKNPMDSNLQIGAFDISGLPSGQTLKGINALQIAQSVILYDTEFKTENISAVPGITDIVGLVNMSDLSTDRILDASQSNYIDLNINGINVASDTFTYLNKAIVYSPYDKPLEAASFVKTGANSSQYLMGDGSILQYSANSGNSNFYLFTSNASSILPPPASGQVRYNTASQDIATEVYISHLTSDNIDVEVFYQQVTQLNDLYIQDKNNSTNFIKYNIIATPTIIVGSYVKINVLMTGYGGTGNSSFGLNHPVLLSFFTNNLEIDTRLSNLESKTIKQTYTGQTKFDSDIVGNKIIKLGGLSSEILLGDGSTMTTTLSDASGNSLSSELTPRGARDVWRNNINGATASLFTLQNNILFAAGIESNNISYSSNGGINWSLCTGLPARNYNKPAYNPNNNLYLSLSGSGVSALQHISSDGAAWTQLAFPTTFSVGFQLIYFNGNFVSSSALANNYAITSSNNGTSWTQRACPKTVNTFTAGFDDLGIPILVSIGGGTTYTYDTINWFSSSTITGTALCYSDTRKEFICYSNINFQFYFSKNGKDWFLNSAAQNFGSLNNTLFYVGNDSSGVPINSYYFGVIDSFGLYRLTYSPTCKSGTFRSVKMTGSSAPGNIYSSLYIPLYDRFVISSSNTPYFRYANNSLSTGLNNGLTINGSVQLNNASLIDICSLDRPFIGAQFSHNSVSLTTISTSLWTIVGNALVVSPFAVTNNATKTLCCAISSPSAVGDGQRSGIVSTSLTGARVCLNYPFGLIGCWSFADTGTLLANGCQNFCGLWNIATTIVLDQAAQLSNLRNFIAFGSNTTDVNLCIYTAGPLSTVKQVDLGSLFPSNRSAIVNDNFYKLSLYWDGQIIYYKAINTLYSNAIVTGSFTPLSTDMPAFTTELYPQLIRAMGSPNGSGFAKLQIQKFGVF